MGNELTCDLFAGERKCRVCGANRVEAGSCPMKGSQGTNPKTALRQRSKRENAQIAILRVKILG
jgi:hypothetical protein